MSYAIATILGGVIAASSLIIARKPNARELLEKITPYQGWLGTGLFAYGIYWLVFFFLRNISAFTAAPLTMAVVGAMLVSGIGVGFLLGFGLISKYTLNKNEAARQKGALLRQRLVAVQVPLGLVAIVSGVLSFVL